jgi:hypothetical protein
LIIEEYVPAGQSEQFRSLVDEGGLLTYEPGLHARHGMQLVAFLALLNEPAAQLSHV